MKSRKIVHRISISTGCILVVICIFYSVFNYAVKNKIPVWLKYDSFHADFFQNKLTLNKVEIWDDSCCKTTPVKIKKITFVDLFQEKRTLKILIEGLQYQWIGDISADYFSNIYARIQKEKKSDTVPDLHILINNSRVRINKLSDELLLSQIEGEVDILFQNKINVSLKMKGEDNAKGIWKFTSDLNFSNPENANGLMMVYIYWQNAGTFPDAWVNRLPFRLISGKLNLLIKSEIMDNYLNYSGFLAGEELNIQGQGKAAVESLNLSYEKIFSMIEDENGKFFLKTNWSQPRPFDFETFRNQLNSGFETEIRKQIVQKINILKVLLPFW